MREREKGKWGWVESEKVERKISLLRRSFSKVEKKEKYQTMINMHFFWIWKDGKKRKRIEERKIVHSYLNRLKEKRWWSRWKGKWMSWIESWRRGNGFLKKFLQMMRMEIETEGEGEDREGSRRRKRDKEKEKERYSRRREREKKWWGWRGVWMDISIFEIHSEWMTSYYE